MKNLAVVLAVLALVGCAELGFGDKKSAGKSVGPQEQVTCSGGESWIDCDKKAKKICGDKSVDVTGKTEDLPLQRRVMRFYCE